MTKALIAMSGGVDSSVAAYLTQQMGYDCIGATMRLVEGEVACSKNARTCCSLQDVEDARDVAYSLGIPFYVFEFTSEFKEYVIENFICSYERGKTPNPCIECNRHMKFRVLLRRAIELGCDYLVTGHYARIEKSGERYYLKKARDLSKDQSYVLYMLTQNQLARLLFPLGELYKAETRAIADRLGFVNAKKRDSQDICFVPDGDYAGFIESYRQKNYPPGKFTDTEGNVLGEHKGIIRYTVGQRKGLGVSASKPLYVYKIDPEANTVVLAEKDKLASDEIEIASVNWIAFDSPPEQLRASVKIRYSQAEQPATVFATGENTARIKLCAPVRAVTPGQSAVIYDGEYVLGGGIIV
ncbi:MAG TPA: tRNA 2-thiouridine(34) synthase MnmA [Bacillota bacterium]|nr:tRNA 2-thiouridine(34) synthase MnmA [Clostridiales bacterium]HPT85919.1 tRNA 2-thiouridine(34) synthase MnmA [Bacillota bacterium]